jgi:hypothetical protein
MPKLRVHCFGVSLTDTAYSRDRADFRLAVNELKGVDADLIFLSAWSPGRGTSCGRRGGSA